MLYSNVGLNLLNTHATNSFVIRVVNSVVTKHSDTQYSSDCTDRNDSALPEYETSSYMQAGFCRLCSRVVLAKVSNRQSINSAPSAFNRLLRQQSR